jgi:cytochrome c-type biogenesis protein
MAEERTAGDGRARYWLTAGLTAGVLGLAVAGGLLAPSAAAGPLIGVESLSAGISGLLLSLGTKAPFAYGFVAGMVAAVNPCGFVLLPAYLGLYLGDDQHASGRYRPVRRAIAVSVTVTAAFMLLFGLAGVLAGLAASALTSALPWIGVAVGAGLILLGGAVASGRDIAMPLGPRAASHLASAVQIRGTTGYAAYGTAYGLASLGCTLPVFIGVVGTSLQLNGLAAAVGQFMLFGAGMGVVLAGLALSTAWFGDGIIRRIRHLTRYVAWASAVLLWLAGGYVVYYWLISIRLL